MGHWKPKTFRDDKCKDMHCRNCGTYLRYDSRLVDDKIKKITCKDCGTVNVIYPPRKEVMDGKKVILFGDSALGKDSMDCTFTADQA